MSKTPEELAEDWAWERTRQISGGDNVWSMREVDLAKDAFLAGYQAAAPQWISVKDRLPELGSTCLIVTTKKEEGISIAWAEKAYWSKWDVTHWMPLPQPPKEEG